jgi:hypothetical protein
MLSATNMPTSSSRLIVYQRQHAAAPQQCISYL